jgi:hypothetical protein
MWAMFWTTAKAGEPTQSQLSNPAPIQPQLWGANCWCCAPREVFGNAIHVPIHDKRFLSEFLCIYSTLNTNYLAQLYLLHAVVRTTTCSIGSSDFGTSAMGATIRHGWFFNHVYQKNILSDIRDAVSPEILVEFPKYRQFLVSYFILPGYPSVRPNTYTAI